MDNIKKYAAYLSRIGKRTLYFPWSILFLDAINKPLSVVGLCDTWFKKKMDYLIIKFLDEKFGCLLDEYKDYPMPCYDGETVGTIWTCWFQGEENAPLLVKKCIESIRKNAGVHPVVVITWNNLSDYVKIPKHIIQLAKNGRITMTHFSDVLRVYLLAIHGGMWLDCTMFYVKPLDESLWREAYFSPSTPKHFIMIQDKYKNSTLFRVCLQIAQKGHPLYLVLAAFFNRYYQLYPIEIHYFLYGYFNKLTLERLNIRNNPLIRGGDDGETAYHGIMLEPSVGGLMAFESLPPAHFFQLTYKQRWLERNKDGRLTVYGKLMSQ